MTDKDLDKMMQKVLIDALLLDWSDPSPTDSPLETSQPFQIRMKTMLADPFKWYRKKTRPLWKKVAQRAAAILLVFSLGFGSLMVVSPTVRAAVIRWALEWYETSVVYRYTGEPLQTGMPQYQITDIPEGYREVDRLIWPTYVSVTYKKLDGTVMYFDSMYMAQGGASAFVTEDVVVSDIFINGWQGQFFLSEDPKQSNAITWMDNKRNIQFTINGFFNKADLVYMAEHISLAEEEK